jgi:hypothetical protein
VRQALLEDFEIVSEAGIPVTSLERTLLDNAAELDEQALARDLAAAERSGRLSWAALERTLEAGEGQAGVARLRKVALEAEPQAVDARSGPEVDFIGLCREAGLAPPLVNVLVGERLVDFLWPEQRLIVELDSYHYHRGRPAFQRDSEATWELEGGGYAVLRVTDLTLERDPWPFMDLLARRLASKIPSRFPSHRWKT